MMYRAKDSHEFYCPLHEDSKCNSSACPTWRFELTPNKDVVAAILIAKVETGEKAPAPLAAKLVADDPARYGLPVGEDRFGWCGLGGKPEVRE